jgi:PPK2 family polyphosphate:nucleotide phosphotransferase
MQFDCPTTRFRVPQDSPVDLNHWPTRIEPLSKNKVEYLNLLAQFRDEISELQSKLYAHDHYAVLMIFQGMDSAGKGGAIKHVMSGINPQGCQVYNFGPPSHEELDHDFLWRTNKRLPERGRIGIFDRSYYEEVLVVRVHPEILHKQRIPGEHLDLETIWQQRFEDIVNLESYLHRNGTRIIKFFLHLSFEEQRRRLLARIDDPQKNWKFTLNDLRSRECWPAYQLAFADCLAHTSSPHSPWFVVPADDKRNARLIVSKILLDELSRLDLNYPVASAEHLEELKTAKKRLKSDSWES